jgi:hypothetical protein
MQLRPHNIVLINQKTRLRPLIESDWDTLFRWNNDLTFSTLWRVTM